MAGKKKTTFTKLARERKLRERRLDKQAKKDARKQGGAQLARTSETAANDDSVIPAFPPDSHPLSSVQTGPEGSGT